MTAAALRPGGVLLRLRHPQPLEGPRDTAVHLRRPGASATSRPRRRPKLKGGNSNWRGPIWFPTSFLLIESLRKLGTAFGRTFGASAPLGRSAGPLPRTWPGCSPTASSASSPATRPAGAPSTADTPKFQNDPHWRDLILFYEYFHGDNGAGLGASHQTGWTALVASLIDEWRS